MHQHSSVATWKLQWLGMISALTSSKLVLRLQVGLNYAKYILGSLANVD